MVSTAHVWRNYGRESGGRSPPAKQGVLGGCYAPQYLRGHPVSEIAQWKEFAQFQTLPSYLVAEMNPVPGYGLPVFPVLSDSPDVHTCIHKYMRGSRLTRNLGERAFGTSAQWRHKIVVLMCLF